MANSLFKDRWHYYSKYEAANTFSKDAPHCELLHPIRSGKANVWADCEFKIQKLVDLTQMTKSDNQRMYSIMLDLLRALRHDAPELISQIMLLCLPRLHEKGWGMCSLCPDGLPLLTKVRPTENMVVQKRPLTARNPK